MWAILERAWRSCPSSLRFSRLLRFYPGPLAAPNHAFTSRKELLRIPTDFVHLIHMTRLFGVILLFFSSLGAQAAAHTQATLLLSESAAKPGSTITAAVKLK